MEAAMPLPDGPLGWDDLPALEQVLVATPMAGSKGERAQIPLGQLAKIRLTPGELMVERGVEKRIARARDQLGQRRVACRGIGEAFPERVVIGRQRGAGEPQAKQDFSHAWNMRSSARVGQSFFREIQRLIGRALGLRMLLQA